jgi:hypothetical protein
MPDHRRRRRLSSTTAVLVVLVACEAPPVAWRDARRGGAADMPPAAGVAASAPPALGVAMQGGRARACAGSLRVARGPGGSRYATWWGVRDDSSVVLLVARSGDGGGSWGAPAAVDTTDRGVRAGARPAPALAADSVNGYVHVAYFIDAAEGPGLFYAHQMDPRSPFEPPSVIVYGERPVSAAVASAGDTVIVAYEDPNRPRPQVELAFSRTGGHLFEERHIDVSGDDVAARAPRVTLGAGGRVAVSWTERPAEAMGAPGVEVVREGRIR